MILEAKNAATLLEDMMAHYEELFKVSFLLQRPIGFLNLNISSPTGFN